MTTYFNPLNNIDLSLLPAPDVIETVNFEAIFHLKRNS